MALSSHLWTRLLGLISITSLLAMLASAVYLWQLRCEGFGCMGIGVAWVAWAGASAVMLLVGLWAAHANRTDGLWRQATRAALLGQLLLVLVMLGLWLLSQMR